MVRRRQGDAHALLAPSCLHQDHAPLEAAAHGHQNRVPHARVVPISVVRCRAFTPELRRIFWPSKFKPDLPPRYDCTPNPAEFLQLYELSIEAANGDVKVMAKWFPMALKDGARSWLLNLPEGSISSWDELHERFMATLLGTSDYAPAMNDLRRVKQQSGETLHKYI